jgi:hypothetical protein
LIPKMINDKVGKLNFMPRYGNINEKTSITWSN